MVADKIDELIGEEFSTAIRSIAVTKKELEEVCA